MWGTHVDLCRSRNVVLFLKVCIGQKPQAFRGSPNRECDIVDGFRYCYCECLTYICIPHTICDMEVRFVSFHTCLLHPFLSV